MHVVTPVGAGHFWLFKDVTTKRAVKVFVGCVVNTVALGQALVEIIGTLGGHGRRNQEHGGQNADNSDLGEDLEEVHLVFMC